jgi:hypothetical protein
MSKIPPELLDPLSQLLEQAQLRRYRHDLTFPLEDLLSVIVLNSVTTNDKAARADGPSSLRKISE